MDEVLLRGGRTNLRLVPVPGCKPVTWGTSSVKAWGASKVRSGGQGGYQASHPPLHTPYINQPHTQTLVANASISPLQQSRCRSFGSFQDGSKVPPVLSFGGTGKRCDKFRSKALRTLEMSESVDGTRHAAGLPKSRLGCTRIVSPSFLTKMEGQVHRLYSIGSLPRGFPILFTSVLYAHGFVHVLVPYGQGPSIIVLLRNWKGRSEVDTKEIRGLRVH